MLLLLLLKKKMYESFNVERNCYRMSMARRVVSKLVVFQKRYPTFHPVRFYSTFFITPALYPKTFHTW